MRTRKTGADVSEEFRRACVRYEGRVQGVGFRYTACRVAERFPVTGYVRNESDGSVCLVVEGPARAIRDLLEGIRKAPVGRYIAVEQTVWEPVQGGFHGFGIDD